MAFSQTNVDALKEAIGTGLLEVQYPDGRKATYRSLREMREILRMMQADVAPGTGATPSRSFVGGF